MPLFHCLTTITKNPCLCSGKKDISKQRGNQKLSLLPRISYLSNCSPPNCLILPMPALAGKLLLQIASCTNRQESCESAKEFALYHSLSRTSMTSQTQNAHRCGEYQGIILAATWRKVLHVENQETQTYANNREHKHMQTISRMI